MDYQTIAQAILQTLPPSQLQPRQTSKLKETDDDRIAQVVWRRMQLEMNLDKPSLNRLSMLV